MKSKLDILLKKLPYPRADDIDVVALCDHIRFSSKNAQHHLLRTQEDLVEFLTKVVTSPESSILKDTAFWEYAASVLNKIVLSPPISAMPVSYLMLKSLPSASEIGKFYNMDSYRDSAWDFVTAYLPLNNLDSAFIPEYLLAYFNETVTPPDQQLRITRFWHELYYRCKYDQIYDIHTDEGRIAFLLDMMIHNRKNAINHVFFTKELDEFWTHEVFLNQESTQKCIDLLEFYSTPRREMLTRLASTGIEIETTARVGAPILLSQYLEKWQSLELGTELHTRKVGKTATTGNQPANTPQITLIGVDGFRTGLGANLKMATKALSSLGIPYTILNTSLEPFLPSLYQDSLANVQLNVKRDVVLFFATPDRIPQQLMGLQTYLEDRDPLVIGFFLWELDRIPRAHELALELLDELWVPCSYLKDIYAQGYEKEIINIKKGLPTLSPPHEWTKEDFGFSKSTTLFTTYFDFGSCIERKNPLAVVKAFKKAFETHEDVGLILKTQNADPSHWGNKSGQWQKILELSTSDSRIKIINENYPFPKLLDLMNVSDAFVSLHRSEGFGYGPAQALQLGTPVIVTDYSGTTDFCRPESAHLVSYKLVRVEDGEFFFDAPGAQWADVDVESAAIAMRSVYQDIDTSKSMAEVGKKQLQNEYSPENFAKNIFDRLTYHEVIK